ncbi:MAG: tRNA pseudouridine(55) synthase TruB [Elusimicrobiaceae bacterium]
MNNPPEEAKSGFLLIDKPSGWTSHDIVAVARTRLGVRRIGHAGTLDPAATGLLVLLVGKATKRQSEFQKGSKVYSGVVALGSETDTWDADGQITGQFPLPAFTPEEVEAKLREMTGPITQIVPAYSAVKVNGKPLYSLARKGIAVEPVEKSVTIFGWKNIAVNLPEVSFEVECSGGTYVRSIAWTLGRNLGCGGHLKSLRRLAVSEFRVDDALDGNLLKTMSAPEIFERLLVL